MFCPIPKTVLGNNLIQDNSILCNGYVISLIDGNVYNGSDKTSVHHITKDVFLPRYLSYHNKVKRYTGDAINDNILDFLYISIRDQINTNFIRGLRTIYFREHEIIPVKVSQIEAYSIIANDYTIKKIMKEFPYIRVDSNVLCDNLNCNNNEIIVMGIPNTVGTYHVKQAPIMIDTTIVTLFCAKTEALIEINKDINYKIYEIVG